MKRSQGTCVLAGLLICGLGPCFPASGCTNANLSGRYLANVGNANLLAILNSIAGTTSSGGSGTSGTNNCQEILGSHCPPAGASTFINSPFGPAGSIPYGIQFYFDGQGNIAGPVAIVGEPSTTVGTYSVNPDCTATMSLTGGATFNAVLVGDGAGVLFMQNNAASGGAVGTLQRSSGICLGNAPQSLAFSLFGAQKASGGAVFNPVSGVGRLQLNGQGGFMMQEWVYQYGKTTASNLSGTYTIGSDCSLSLTFNPSSAGGVTAPITAPGVIFPTGVFVSQ
jgi:hypothetical protein